MSMRMGEMLYTAMVIYFYNEVDKCYCLYITQKFMPSQAFNMI